MALPKTVRQGYILSDNRLAEGRHAFHEGGVFTCSHCERQILKDPGFNQDLCWCRSCDRFVCERCKAISVVSGCKPYAQVIEEHMRSAEHMRIF